MRSFAEWIEGMLDRCLSHEIKSDYEVKDLYKARFLAAIAAFFAIISTVSIVSQLVIASTINLTMIVPFISIFTCAVILSLLKTCKTHQPALMMFQCSFMVLLPLAVIHNNSILSPPMFCMPIIPMLFYVLGDIKRALLIFGICFAISVGGSMFFLENPYLDDAYYRTKSVTGIISVFAASMIILGLAYLSKKLGQLAEADLLQQRNKAENTEKMKTRFLANISHEIRTPLNNVIGHSELLRDRLAAHDFSHYHIENIFRSSRQLTDIINNVIEASRLDTDSYDLKQEEVDLPSVIYDNAILNISEAEAKGLNVTFHISDRLRTHSVSVSKQALAKVIYHLVSNATKFTAKGQITIKVDFDTALQCLTLSISDTGVGIDDHTIASMYDKFLQGNEEMTREFGGLGLGLTITKAIVDKVSGEISVISKPGVGSTFHIKLPGQIVVKEIYQGDRSLKVHVLDPTQLIAEYVHATSKIRLFTSVRYRSITQLASAHLGHEDIVIIQVGMGYDSLTEAVSLILDKAPGAKILVHGNEVAQRHFDLDTRYTFLNHISDFVKFLPDAHQQPQDSVAVNSSQQAQKILVVDDAEDNRALMRLYLESHGFDITAAEDGIEALEAVKRERFDLILMDIQMPRMDGFEATAKIMEWEVSQPDRSHTPIVIVTAHDIEEHREQSEQLKTAGFITKPLRKKSFIKEVNSVINAIDSKQGAA